MDESATVVTTGKEAFLDPAWNEFVADRGTVFHSGHFLSSWWHDHERSSPRSESTVVSVANGSKRVGVCAFETRESLLRFAGGSDTVDYMGPVAAEGHEDEVARALVDAVFADLSWRRAWLGGLDSTSATVQRLVAAVRSRDATAVMSVNDHVPRIDSAPGGYLASLSSKRRAEVLRKRNRLSEALGDTRVLLSDPDGWREPLDRLLGWKAAASPKTSAFVDRYGDFVRRMVGGLAADGAARLAELHVGGRPAAAAILLIHGRTRYLYNMSFDLALVSNSPKPISPGVVLVSHLVELALDSGLRFDFLKGAQDYKLRLGGIPEELIAIELKR